MRDAPVIARTVRDELSVVEVPHDATALMTPECRLAERHEIFGNTYGVSALTLENSWIPRIFPWSEKPLRAPAADERMGRWREDRRFASAERWPARAFRTDA